MENYTDFGVSYLIQTFVNKINKKLLNDCPVIAPPPSPLTPEFQIIRKNFLHFMRQVKILCCSNRSSGVYPLNQGHMT